MTKKILIVDNHVGYKCNRCSKFHRHFSAKTAVMHRVHKPFPKNLSGYSHVILTGGDTHLDEFSKVYKRLRPFIKKVEREGIPMLGICYGFEAIVAALSDYSEIEYYKKPAIGFTKIKIISPSRIFKDIPKSLYVFENHMATVRHLPSSLRKIAISKSGTIEAFEHKSKPIFGVQFHPEYTVFQAKNRIALRLKQHLPMKWFSNIEDSKKFDTDTAEKIITNFYYSTKDFKKR